MVKQDAPVFRRKINAKHICKRCFTDYPFTITPSQTSWQKTPRKVKVSLFPPHSYHIYMDRKEEKRQKVIWSPCNSNTCSHSLYYPMILRILNENTKAPRSQLMLFSYRSAFHVAESEITNSWLSAICFSRG